MSAMSKLYIELQVADALMEVFDSRPADWRDDTPKRLIEALEERDIELRPL